MMIASLYSTLLHSRTFRQLSLARMYVVFFSFRLSPCTLFRFSIHQSIFDVEVLLHKLVTLSYCLLSFQCQGFSIAQVTISVYEAKPFSFFSFHDFGSFFSGSARCRCVFVCVFILSFLSLRLTLYLFHFMLSKFGFGKFYSGLNCEHVTKSNLVFTQNQRLNKRKK